MHRNLVKETPPMAPHEIFSQMTPVVASQIFSFLFEKEKPLYKATLETLAKKRNLRPVFVERKPRDERFAWLKDSLGRAINDAVAAHLLQVWLIGTQTQMLCDFLDALGITHDENGTVEQLPPAPAKEALAGAIDTLLSKHEAATVAVYLHTFQALHEEGKNRSRGVAIKGWNPLFSGHGFPPLPSSIGPPFSLAMPLGGRAACGAVLRLVGFCHPAHRAHQPALQRDRQQLRNVNLG